MWSTTVMYYFYNIFNIWKCFILLKYTSTNSMSKAHYRALIDIINNVYSYYYFQRLQYTRIKKNIYKTAQMWINCSKRKRLFVLSFLSRTSDLWDGCNATVMKKKHCSIKIDNISNSNHLSYHRLNSLMELIKQAEPYEWTGEHASLLSTGGGDSRQTVFSCFRSTQRGIQLL